MDPRRTEDLETLPNGGRGSRVDRDCRRPPVCGDYEEYHPFGSTAWWAGDSSTVSQKRYRYTGMERDEETGLSYHHHRYYATWLGRWTSSDPIGLAAGINFFEYCNSSPAINSDILGLDPPPNAAKGRPGYPVSGGWSIPRPADPKDVIQTPLGPYSRRPGWQSWGGSVQASDSPGIMLRLGVAAATANHYSPVPATLARHYAHGKGRPLVLTPEEGIGTNPVFDVTFHSKAGFGAKTRIVRLIEKMRSEGMASAELHEFAQLSATWTHGTFGESWAVFNGSLTVQPTGAWTFSGTVRMTDLWDFNPAKEGEESYRSPRGEFKTWVGSYLLAGGAAFQASTPEYLFFQEGNRQSGGAPHLLDYPTYEPIEVSDYFADYAPRDIAEGQ